MKFFTIHYECNDTTRYYVRNYSGRIIEMEYSAWLTYQDTLENASIYYEVIAA
jgi:hypothetical protein